MKVVCIEKYKVEITVGNIYETVGMNISSEKYI